MSSNYTDTMVLCQGAVSGAYTAGDILGYVWAKNFDYQVYALQFLVTTAATNADTKFQLTTLADAVVAEVTIGGLDPASAPQMAEVLVADAKVDRTAGEILKVVLSKSDNGIRGQLRVFGSATYN